MANGTTIPLTPSAGGLNYADYEEQIRQTAAKTRTVSDPGVGAANKLAKTLQKGSAARAQASAGITNYQQQALATKTQAGKAATALEMVGSSTLQGVKNLETIQGNIKTQVQSASDSWGAAAEKADEYVKASRGRVGEVLAKMDEINTQISKNRDFAKAHNMQASVQAVMGSMKSEERNIMETYGTESKEYQQFQASKLNTLATVQSNLHATYQQLAEDQGKTFLNATSDAYTKSNMYVGFQEQQHVEMLKFSSEQKATYSIQAAQLDTSIEQMKMSGMENLANWIVETPTFTIDSTPLMTLLADLGAGAGQRSVEYDQVSTIAPGGIRTTEPVRRK